MLYELIHFVLLVAGLTYLLTKSAVFALVRVVLSKFFKILLFRKAFLYVYPLMLLYCPACVGFWFGFVLAKYFHAWPFPAYVNGPIEAAICSCALMAWWSDGMANDDAWASEQE